MAELASGDVIGLLTKEEMQNSFCIIQTNEMTEEAKVISQSLSTCDFRVENEVVSFFCEDIPVSVHLKIGTMKKIIARLSNYIENSNTDNIN